MDLDSFLYGEMFKDGNPRTHDILIAEPMLSDDLFARSVVLMLDVDKDMGDVGLILNRPTNVMLSEILPLWPKEVDMRVFCGGPVGMEKHYFFLHTLGERIKGAIELMPGLYINGDIKDIIDYMEEHPEERHSKIRFFLGYSGWAKDQLQAEIIGHSWAVLKNPDINDLLVGYGENYWRREVQRLGEGYRSWLSVPADPNLN